MMEFLPSFAMLLAGGAGVGLLSGLLGVGGAVIVVPLLDIYFRTLQTPDAISHHMALGTSLAAIMFTSLTSFLAHARLGSMRWDLFRLMVFPVILGTLSGSLLAPDIPAMWLRLVFSLFVFGMGMHLLRPVKPAPRFVGRGALIVAGFCVGCICSLAGIAGSLLCLSVLTLCSVDWNDALGTSAALSFPITFTGAAGYIVGGWQHTALPAWSLGFVNVPAVVIILAGSVGMTIVGARMAHDERLPLLLFRRLFAMANLAIGLWGIRAFVLAL